MTSSHLQSSQRYFGAGETVPRSDAVSQSCVESWPPGSSCWCRQWSLDCSSDAGLPTRTAAPCGTPSPTWRTWCSIRWSRALSLVCASAWWGDNRCSADRCSWARADHARVRRHLTHRGTPGCGPSRAPVRAVRLHGLLDSSRISSGVVALARRSPQCETARLAVRGPGCCCTPTSRGTSDRCAR